MEKYRIILILAIMVFLGVTGCSTPSAREHEFDKIQLGMLKSEVLDVAGPPKWTDRQNSQDLWIYLMKSNDRESERIVYFENGKVVQTGLRNKPALTAEEEENLKNPRPKDIHFKPSMSEDQLRKEIKKEIEKKNPQKPEKFEKI